MAAQQAVVRLVLLASASLPCADGFLPSSIVTVTRGHPQHQQLQSVLAVPLALSGTTALRGGSPSFADGGGAFTANLALQRSSAHRGARAGRTTTARMTASDNKASEELPNNAGALALALACSAGASAVAEISPHAAAFVQLVCLSVWLGMSVYATFVWPIITGINMRDSSEFATLLGKLGPSYLQLSAAMILSLATSSVVIGHSNGVQLYILGAALGINLYNAFVVEPTAVGVLEEELAVERRVRGKQMKRPQDDDLPKVQAQLANFLGAEVLLDLLSILCAVCYAWDLASSISFS